MSPATLLQQDDQARQIVALAEGFGALLKTSQKLAGLEKELRSRLSFAHDEYMKLLNRIGDKIDLDNEVPEKLHPNNIRAATIPVPLDVTQWISPAEEAGVVTPMEVKLISKGVQTWRRVGGTSHCTVGANGRKAANGMEKDFTTVGVQGRLRCPFAIPNGSMANGATGGKGPDSCGQPDADPMKAQRSAVDPSTVGSTSARGSTAAAKCPIRYLDDHSPEEVAQYFETHKHDLPRSHAICIQRYQKDSQSLRQIDQKYGDMVTMIQGLGQYHKPLLEEGEEKEVEEDNQASVSEKDAARIRDWAKNVPPPPPPPADGDGEVTKVQEQLETGEPNPPDKDEDDERKSHFERQPLREVRLGESPSRPWGIHVPLSHRVKPDPPNTNKDAHPSVAAKPPAKCPFTPKPAPATDGAAEGNGNEQASPPQDENRPPSTHHQRRDFSITPKPHVAQGQAAGSHTSERPDQHPPIPSTGQMVFNGPVFFGFSAGDTAAILQSLGPSAPSK